MKKFEFSLETVLGFKEQLADRLKHEYFVLEQATAVAEQILAVLQEELLALQGELQQRMEETITMLDLKTYQQFIKKQKEKILQQQAVIIECEREQEAKREEIILMKIEITSVEKLKERRYEEYQETEKKQEERFVEEFVVNQGRLTSFAT